MLEPDPYQEPIWIPLTLADVLYNSNAFLRDGVLVGRLQPRLPGYQELADLNQDKQKLMI